MTTRAAEVPGVRNSGGPGLGSSGVSDPAHVPSERRRGTGLAATGPPAPSTAGPGWTPSGPSSVSGRRGRAVDPNRRSLGRRYECRGTVLSSYRHVRRCRTAPTPVLEHRRRERGGRTWSRDRRRPPPAGPPRRTRPGSRHRRPVPRLRAASRRRRGRRTGSRGGRPFAVRWSPGVAGSIAQAHGAHYRTTGVRVGRPSRTERVTTTVEERGTDARPRRSHGYEYVMSISMTLAVSTTLVGSSFANRSPRIRGSGPVTLIAPSRSPATTIGAATHRRFSARSPQSNA